MGSLGYWDFCGFLSKKGEVERSQRATLLRPIPRLPPRQLPLPLPASVIVAASKMGEVAYEQPSSPQQSDSEVSVSSGEMETHVADTATPIEHICRWSKCEMLFVSLEDLADHVSKYHGHAGRGGLFYCGWEGCSRGQRGFNARYKMLVHVRTHTNEKPHHCFTCDKSFSRAENLKIHARSHTGERPYVCPMPGCKKAYSNSSDRFKHTRTHTVEKPYRCKVPGCPKRYTDPSSLRKHVKTYRHYPVTAGETPAIESPPPQPPASVTAPAQLGIRLQQQQQQPHPTFFAHEVPANPRPAIPTFTLMDSLTPMMPAQSSIPLWMSLGGHMSLLNPYCNTEVQKAPLELLNTYCTTEVQETPLDLTINRAACV